MDFSFLTNLFHSNALAPEALHWVPGWLPDPAWFGAALAVAIALLVASFFFALLPKRLLMEAVAILFVASVISVGYEHAGENKIIPERNQLAAQVKLDADRADSFRSDAKSLSDQLAKAIAAKRPIIVKRITQTNEAIHAQPEAVRTIVIPAAVGELLNRPLDTAAGDANPAAAGAAAAQGAAAAAVPRVCSDTTVEAWEGWSTTVRGQYEQLASDYNALYIYSEGLYAASVKANATPGSSP